MADISKKTDGLPPSDPTSYDITSLPDWDDDFVNEDDFAAFAAALSAPDTSPSQDDLTSPSPLQSHSLFITALNDWRPVRQKVRRKKKGPSARGTDEAREGFVYTLLKWPLLLTVLGWLLFLGISYLFTRFYIFLYEHWISWRGRRERLRKALREQTSYEDWIKSATRLDAYLGNDRWKTIEEYAYYDSRTIKRVRNHMRRCRKEAETKESSSTLVTTSTGQRPIDELRVLVEACIRDNFAGFENPRLYSETYYGSKELVQSFVDEAEASLSFLLRTQQLDSETKHTIWKHLQTNLGRTALCLSGGAAFAYYHFGIAKALLDAGLLPQVITGTSGGALVAALLATRTDDELKKLLIPALAHRINACQDGTWTWFTRWWRTGARFDTIDWAKGCSWFTRGSMTFREAYERTGRILNVSCVPSDPHSPAILANYLTSPDCVIWSAVLASAAVPGILNPVVLMKKNSVGRLEPYSFGHKWKDGSLRTDIPLKALNLHFNVNFSIVSQVNPHINLFFFSSRGSVGRPVTHRKGRGWRGGFLGSATEQYLKLDLTKWLKVLRHLELLPRPLGQDWSQLWLQRFSGTITIWPKSVPSDFYYILSDPSPSRLARMIHVGQLATWPKLKFVANRMKLEKLIEEGRRGTRPARQALTSVLSEDDLEALLKEAKQKNGTVQRRPERPSPSSRSTSPELLISTNVATGKPLSHTPEEMPSRSQSPSLGNKLRGWFSRRSTSSFDRLKTSSDPSPKAKAKTKNQVYQSYAPRSGSVIMEMARQSSVFFDDDDFDADSALEEDTNHGSGNGSGVDLGRDGLSEDEDDDDSGIDEASSGTEEPTADD